MHTHTHTHTHTHNPAPNNRRQVTAYLRDAEAGVAGFSEAWAEWIGSNEPPGVLVLQASTHTCARARGLPHRLPLLGLPPARLLETVAAPLACWHRMMSRSAG
jgi:hypothetical protein